MPEQISGNVVHCNTVSQTLGSSHRTFVGAEITGEWRLLMQCLDEFELQFRKFKEGEWRSPADFALFLERQAFYYAEVAQLDR